MTKARERWWPVLTTVALVLVQAPALSRSAGDPLQSDFVNYLVPARVLASGGDLAGLYDPWGFEAALRETGLETLGSFVPHPPANALWLLPFASLSPAAAKTGWTALLVIALGAAFACLRRLAPGVDPWITAVVVLGPTLAIRNGLAFGQPYPVLLALLSLGLLGLERGRPFVGGFLVGSTVPFKPYAAPIGLAFLLARPTRARALPGFALGMLLPMVALFALAGGDPLAMYFERVVPWMRRGEIQDPSSPVWGSATALAQHLFRFEPDLNPHPWLQAPRLARFLGACAPVWMTALGVLAARRALVQGRTREALGAGVAFALAASPFAASYHLVLLAIPALVLVARFEGRRRLSAIAVWLLLGSPIFGAIRAAAGEESVLAYARFAAILALAFWVAEPVLVRRDVAASALAGVVAGGLALGFEPRAETWPRVAEARGYSMTRPYFCGEDLRWMSPSASGRSMESRGTGEDCRSPRIDGLVVSRFSEGSWNLYWDPDEGAPPRRLTFSDANEVDPALAPDGCSVVFASDQGRGLGSTALYRLDISALNRDCDRARPGADPR